MTGETLLRPRRGDTPAGTDRSGAQSRWSLPPDLLAESRSRLRVVALLLAFVFAMITVVDPLVAGGNLFDYFFGHIVREASGAITISLALILAVLCGSRRISDPALLNVGLAFEVAPQPR